MKRDYTSLHNHTTFCDGRDSMEDTVRFALAQGVRALGFSAHSYVPFDPEGGMPEGAARAYRAELLRLRTVYGDRIALYCGIEQELYSPWETAAYDYVIGSAHYARQGERYYVVDAGPKRVQEAVALAFGGDPYAFIASYYDGVSRLAARAEVDIVGHFDLVTKFNEGGALFSEDDPRYVEPALAAMERLVQAGKIFEMNSGAVSRGCRKTPYIARPLLQKLHEMGGRVTLSADAHRKEHLLFLFDEMAETLKSCGFTELWQFDGKTFYPTPLA